MSITAAEMLRVLRKRLFDINDTQFSDDELISELDLAQEEFVLRAIPENLGKLTVSEENIVFDGSGSYDLSKLNNSLLDTGKGVLRLSLYIKDSLTGSEYKKQARSLSEDELRKVLNNEYYSGTNQSPKYSVSGNTLRIYAGNLTIRTTAAVAGHTSISALLGEALSVGGPLSGQSDYYNGFYLKSENGNIYTVGDYIGSAMTFVLIGPTIRAEDAGCKTWELLTPSQADYCGMGKITYLKKPTKISNGDCQLDDHHANIVILIAESNIWRSDGKLDNAQLVSQNAMNQINMLNGAIKATDNVGYRATKY